MSNPLIINARRQLSWNRRLFSDASTLALWTMWLWLCRSALLRLMDMLGMALGLRHAPVAHVTGAHAVGGTHAATAHSVVGHVAITHATSIAQAVPANGMLTIEDAIVALIGTCSLLMLWNRLASQPAPTPRINLVPDYAGHFGLEPRVLAEARDSGVCVVHHDEAGRIVGIDSGTRGLPIAA